MRVSAIMTAYSSYYYDPYEANMIARTKTVKEIKRTVETTQTSTYQTNIYKDSARYVKNAYDVSFRPHDMIVNLQV